MPTDLAKVKELFLALLDMTATERATYLDSACEKDPELRQRLEMMLRNHEISGELLARSPAEMLDDSEVTANATAAFTPPVGDAGAESTQSIGDGDDLSFLAASSGPGDLGRLGHYEIRQVLGRGGFGIVLKGFDERLHRIVAIKVLSPAYAVHSAARKRFIREARAAAAVKNEHVVGIHDVQEDAQPPYLVMECVDGISLQDKIDKHGPLGVKEILRIGMQIAEGLSAAHRQGLVHRDIKPANILLENGVERVKITDFGLARAVDDASVTQSGAIAGTPMYMSPEQAEGLAVDHRSDLFSLGSVLYAMATGHTPFRASSTHAVLKRVIDATPRSIQEVNIDIPKWLCDIIAKLHAKRPMDRFTSAGEVADLLGQHLAHLQQPASVPRPVDIRLPQYAGVKLPRRRLRKFVAAGLALGAIAVFACYVMFSRPRSGSPDEIAELADPVTGLHVRSHTDADVTVVRVDPDPGWVWGGAVNKVDHKSFVVSPGIYRVRALRNNNWIFEETGIVEANATRQFLVMEKPPPLPRPIDAFGTNWGMFIDPRDDCKATPAANGLTIKVPGNAPHDLNPTSPWFNVTGPRILRDVAGDFDAQVTVPPFRRPEPFTMSGLAGGSFIAAGIVVWIDDTRFMRFVRNAKGEFQGGAPFLSAVWNHGNDKLDATSVESIPDTPTSLRVERVGKILRLSYREGDGQWKVFTEIANWPMPEKVQVGIAALNTTAFEFEPRFEDFSATGLKTDEPEWFPLFNGKNLEGWQPLWDHKNWSVEDGILVGKSPPNMLKTTRDDFADFHLRAEVKFNPGGNSGVFFRCQPADGVPRPGYEVEIGTGEKNKTGSVMRYPGEPWVLYQESKDFAASDAWNTVEIIAQGNRIVTKVNGHQGADIEHAEYRKGRIELQVFGGNTRVEFRKVEIKELAPIAAVRASAFLAFSNRDDATEYVRFKARDQSTDNSDMTLKPRGSVGQMIQPGTYKIWTSKDRISWKQYGDFLVNSGGHTWFTVAGGELIPEAFPAPAIVPFDAAKAGALQTAWAKALQVAPEITDSVGIKMRLIPAGMFQMGSPEQERNRFPNERSHQVTLGKPYFIGAFPVTVGQFRAFVIDSNFETDAEKGGGAQVFVNGDFKIDPTANWRNPGFDQSDDFPVVSVSCNDANAFCEWLSKKEGKKYMLPTEAQWEFACRAGTTTPAYFSNDETLVNWVFEERVLKPRALGRFKSNAWGLFDMHGNVWQWTTDRYAADPAAAEPEFSENRTIRGGGWDRPAVQFRSSLRFGEHAPESRGTHIGFRVVCDVPRSPEKQ